MMDDDDAPAAETYALGLMSGADYQRAAEKARRDPGFADEVRAIENMLLPLALRLKPVAPSDTVFDRVEVRISALASRSGVAKVNRSGDGEWLERGPGFRSKVLHEMSRIGRQTYLLQLDPGAVVASHEHDDDEECYVISGDISFGDILLGPGDYYVAPRGWRHGAIRSSNGCLCLVVAAMD